MRSKMNDENPSFEDESLDEEIDDLLED